MKFKLKIILIGGLILIGTGVVLFHFLNERPQDSSTVGAKLSPPQASAPNEITIRNVTKEAIVYDLAPDDSKAKPLEKKLALGAIDRIPAAQQMIITLRGDKSYYVFPGKAYSFRYNMNKKIQLFDGSHGRSDEGQ